MKKISYMAPEMKVRTWNIEAVMQYVSGGDKVPVDNEEGDDEGTAKDFDLQLKSVWED